MSSARAFNLVPSPSEPRTMEALSGHDDAELVTVAALLQKLPPLPSVFHDRSESSSSSSQSPRSNPAATSTLLGDKSDSGKRKIVSCLDCHSRKVKVRVHVAWDSVAVHSRRSRFGSHSEPDLTVLKDETCM